MAGLQTWLRVAVAGLALVAAAGPAGEETLVNLSCDQVDVPTFVKLIGEMTGQRFAVAENVTGKVTVVAPRVPRSEVEKLFLAILETAGCAMVRDGALGRIVKLPERQAPVAPVLGPDEPVPETGVFTKIIRLKNASASEVRKVLETSLQHAKGGMLGALDETNHLIVTDTAPGIRRIEGIVAEIDRPGMARVTVVMPLEFAGAEELARQLSLAMQDGESRADLLRRRLPAVEGAPTTGDRRPVVVASPHANSLIVVGTPTQVEELQRIVKQMDVDTPAGRTRLNAIFLRYINAEDAAKSLNALLKPPVLDDKNQQAEPVKRTVAIQSSEANNALLVDATPGDFDAVKKLIEQLDQAPAQVHIQVVIAEVSVSDDFSFGVEMTALDMPSKVGDTVMQGSSRLTDGVGGILNNVQQGLFPRGISVGLAQGNYVDSAGKVVAAVPGAINIDAMKKDGRFDVLSDTSLEAQNNKEASVNIVDSIPVLKSTIEGGGGTTRDVIQNIERIDVGIKLKLKPHIVPGGEVQMVLNPSIEAVIDPGPTTSGGGQFTPTIAKREASTTVTVPDGKTIIIAGLTRQDTTKNVRKVPILGYIPVIGWLFTSMSETKGKTDLLIFVTPRVVTGVLTSDEVMADWKTRTAPPDGKRK